MSHAIPVVLITGASRGLGRGIAMQVAGQGYSAVINFAGNKAAAEETIKLCKESQTTSHQRFVPIKADVGSKEERERLVRETLNEFGRIDALVNNAGIAPKIRADVTEMSEESFAEVLRVNLQGAFFLTQAVANYWLSQKPQPLLGSGFKIIFVSSVSAEIISLNRGEYCMSKAGLSMAVKLWAARLAEQGIQVLELRPGIMATDMTTGVKEKYDKQLSEGLVPMRRWGTAEDVGLAVGSILSGNFPFSTGDVVYIDGGLHLQKL